MANTFKGAFLYCIKFWACSSIMGNKRNIIRMKQKPVHFFDAAEDRLRRTTD